MIIAKNDEDKRSRIWKRTTIISSVLIVVIAVYLLTKMFSANPLEGEWESEDGAVVLEMRPNGVLFMDALELSEGGDVSVKMGYVLDKDEKTISIHVDEKEYERLSEESGGQYTKEELESAVSFVATTFNYSVDNSQLTLTEREYGEQMTFMRK